MDLRALAARALSGLDMFSDSGGIDSRGNLLLSSPTAAAGTDSVMRRITVR